MAAPSTFHGRRPVKTKGERLPSQLFRWLGARSRVDVVAHQVLDHDDDGIFHAVTANDTDAVMQLVDDNVYCLLLRDSVGAAPIHLAFLYGHYDLGKLLVLRAPQYATITYAHLDAGATERSPYEGENVLHIAIVHRQAALVQWLLEQAPALLCAETTGKFFRPRKACYFGGTPLLFALSSNQVSVALDILAAASATTDKETKVHAKTLTASVSIDRDTKSDTNGPSIANASTSTAKSAAHQPNTSIFMCDRFGNNALHMAVIHDLPNVYNFALQYAMELLAPPSTAFDNVDDAGGPTAAQASDAVATCGEHLAPSSDVSAATDQPHSTASSDVNASALPPSIPHQQPAKTTYFEVTRLRLHARFAAFTAAATATDNSNDTTAEFSRVDSLVEYMKRVNDVAHDVMLAFVLQRNDDELTPLSLAAAIGNERMFQHILRHSTSVAWCFGPITALHVPLLDLEQPILRPDSDHGAFQVVHNVLAALPYPLAPKGKRGYKTAIQCLCSLEPLSNTLSARPAVMRAIISARLEMLRITEVKLLLHKKWKYVGKRRFLTRLAAYVVFLALLNTATLIKQTTHRQNVPLRESIALSVLEASSVAIAFVKFMNESNQLLFNVRAYTTEAGAGQLDNVCTFMASAFLFLSAAMRAAGSSNSDNSYEDLEDAFAAVALIFAWFYLFFFLLGFRSTGPFVIMILTMIANDIVRFIFVYVAVLAGFSQALYLVLDGRAGPAQLLHRARILLIAGFTGEVNYDDNYTDSRMNPFTQVLVLAYVILVMILLVNLLIAMMGNTYSEILQESEQRWVAERANIMATIENQCSAARNHADRKRYAIPLRSRRGDDDLYLQLEVNDMAHWKAQRSRGHDVGNDSDGDYEEEDG